jgi:hypothetical protein
MVQQNYWTERGRAASVANSDATGRPRRSVPAFATNAHMTIYWSLKHIPELSGRSWQERVVTSKRFRSYMLRSPVNRWSVSALLSLIILLLGSAFASSFLPELPGACVVAIGGIGAFYSHYLISLNYMSRCLRAGEFKIV